MTRRRGLIVSGIASLLLLLAMSPAENRMKDTGGPGMVPFELTGGQDRADEILAEWGEDGQDAARESLWIDFGFLLAYGAFLTLALAATRDLAIQRGWHRLGAIGRVAVWFGALAAAFDALENACLLLTLDGSGAAFPLLATIFASLKFFFLAVAIAYVLAGFAIRLSGPRAPRHRRRLRPRTATRCSRHRRGQSSGSTTLPDVRSHIHRDASPPSSNPRRDPGRLTD